MASCSAVIVCGGLVVVNNFNFVRVSGIPAEADAPLIVDADAVLPGPVPLKGFKAVAGRNAESLQGGGGIEDVELVNGPLEKIGRKAGALALPELLRLLVAEVRNHPSKLSGLR